MTEKRVKRIIGKIDVKANGLIQLANGPFLASDLRSITENNATITRVRANIINNALWVEDFLDEIIEKLLFPRKETKLVFKESMYNDLRFRKKGNIFKSILNNKLVTLDKPDEIIRQVQEIITVRNDFAHGKVIFKRRKMFLTSLNGKETELNDSFFDKENDNFRKASETLSYILKKLE